MLGLPTAMWVWLRGGRFWDRDFGSFACAAGGAGRVFFGVGEADFRQDAEGPEAGGEHPEITRAAEPLRAGREEVADGSQSGAGEEQERGDLERWQSCVEEFFVSRMTEHDTGGDSEGDEAEAAEENDVQTGDALDGPEERENETGDEREQR